MSDTADTNDLFLRLLQLSPLPIAVTRFATGEFVEANDSLLAMLGYSRDEVIGHTTTELGVWDSAGDRAAFLARLTERNAKTVWSNMPISTRAAERIIDAVALSLVEWRGETCLLAVIRGSEEREQFEAIRRRREAHLRILTEQLPAIFWTTDRDLKITSCGGSGLAALGVTPAQLNERSLADYYETTDPDFLPIVAHRRALDGTPANYDHEWLGKIYHTHVEAQREDGRITGCIGVCVDVTEHRRAEEALRESEERYRRLVSVSFDGIMIQVEDRVVYINQAGASLFGAESPDQVVGMVVFDRLPAKERASARERAEAVLSHEKSVPLAERRIIRLDGVERVVEGAAVPITYCGRRAALVVIRDITERKAAAERVRLHAEELEDLVRLRTERLHELEQQRAQVDKLVVTGRMAADIAHEINNPLAGIKNSFQLIKDCVPPDHRYFAYVERIESEIDRIARIVRQMLDLHRGAPEAPRAFPLARLIGDVVSMLTPCQRESGIVIEVETLPENVTVTLPEDSLRQVLINVVKNAVEASPSRGRVRITVAAAGEQIQIRVADQGAGIPEADLAHIYEPFFTTKNGGAREGVGLGLTISHGLVEAMRGSILHARSDGGGTVCTITLPRIV